MSTTAQPSNYEFLLSIVTPKMTGKRPDEWGELVYAQLKTRYCSMEFRHPLYNERCLFCKQTEGQIYRDAFRQIEKHIPADLMKEIDRGISVLEAK